ncbi:MAG: hypothetical protein OXE50_13450, partial [Chloroflexi bacterium]|nr:hypothetical protein [Chloroflexota bacterium]
MAHFFDSATPVHPETRLRRGAEHARQRGRLLRFAGVPLLALCAAVALVLLTPPPAPANITEGTSSVGSGGTTLTVAVFADIADAQNAVPSQGVGSSGAITAGDAAYILNGADARNTFSNHDLYVSNRQDAYDTVLITTTVTGVADGGCAEATLTNKRGGGSVTVLLAPTSAAPVGGSLTYQGVARIADWDEENADGPACGDYASGTDALAALRARDGARIAVPAQGVLSS